MKLSLLSFAVFAAVLVDAGRIPPPRPTTTKHRCPIVTPTTPPTSTTELPTETTSIPPSCVNTPGTTVRATKTLAFEDVDSLAASRVPLPDGYQGFSHSDPANNKVYRSGPPPVSVSSPNVLYVNNGRLELGAVGFAWNPQTVNVLTFLDPENGVTSARLRISGLLVQPFDTVITTDRAFVEVQFPAFDRLTATNLVLELFKGDSTTERLPFWIDDFVYVRRTFLATCCQVNNPNPITTLAFDDLPKRSAPRTYKSFSLGPARDLSISAAPENNPSKPNALYKKQSASPLSLTSLDGRFNLLSLTVTISQYTPGPFTAHQTRILILGFSESGEQLGSWDIPAITHQPGTYSVHLGGDWERGNTGGLYINGREGGGGANSGYFSAAGFRGVTELRIQVTELTFVDGRLGPETPKPFWVDDVQVQKVAGCEEDF